MTAPDNKPSHARSNPIYASTIALSTGSNSLVAAFTPAPNEPLPVAATLTPLIHNRTRRLLGMDLSIGHNSDILNSWLDTHIHSATTLTVDLWEPAPGTPGKTMHVHIPKVGGVLHWPHKPWRSYSVPDRWYYIFGTAGHDDTDTIHSMVLGPEPIPTPDITIPIIPNPEPNPTSPEEEE